MERKNEAMKKTIAVFGTLDTKGEAYQFLGKQLESFGLKVLMIDTGIHSDHGYSCDIDARQVAEAGGAALEEIQEHDRTFAFEIMGKGSAEIIGRLCSAGQIHGAVSMGGGQGTLLAAMVMRALPIGFPKLILSTIANLRTPPFEGIKDTMVVNSLVDISGLNHILKAMIRKAAAAAAGMVLYGNVEMDHSETKRPAVAMSMFGVTTPCVEHMREILEQNGYEAIVFHSNGQGGRMMEAMIRDGMIQLAADITTGEITQELLGGNCSAGPHRLEAAPEKGIPQLIVPGAMELANFMPPSSLPEKYEGRKYYMHNPNLKLLRANAAESREAGKILAEKVNASKGPVLVMLPLLGISQYDSPGGPLEDPEADKALFSSIKEHLRPDIPLEEVPLHINDPKFAELAAKKLMALYQCYVDGGEKL